MRGEIIDGVHRRDTMKAIVQDTYGSPDVLELREIDKPVVEDDEVLVRVHAAGVDQGVWHLMTGMPYLMRIAGFGLRAPKDPVRGYDVAGCVEAVGENVTPFQPGDQVFGTCRGSFAEDARARADRLLPGGLRRRPEPLRRHPRHRRESLAVTPPARPRSRGDARDRRRRRGRTVARRHRSPAPGVHALAVRAPEAGHVDLAGAQGGPG